MAQEGALPSNFTFASVAVGKETGENLGVVRKLQEKVVSGLGLEKLAGLRTGVALGVSL